MILIESQDKKISLNFKHIDYIIIDKERGIINPNKPWKILAVVNSSHEELTLGEYSTEEKALQSKMWLQDWVKNNIKEDGMRTYIVSNEK